MIEINLLDNNDLSSYENHFYSWCFASNRL